MLCYRIFLKVRYGDIGFNFNDINVCFLVFLCVCVYKYVFLKNECLKDFNYGGRVYYS